MAFIECPDCGAKLIRFGQPHECKRKGKSSGGGGESRRPTNQGNESRSGDVWDVAQSGRAPTRGVEVVGSNPTVPRQSGSHRKVEKVKRGVEPTPIVPIAGVASGPSEIKRGRPRIGEPRITTTKPWIAMGMSERTYYRRQAEKKQKI